MGLFSNECAACGSKEHSTSDCPHGIFSTKCASCGSIDHATKDCPRGIFSTKCASCGSNNHATKDCPHGIFSTKCASCGSIEHATKDCPHGIFSTKCASCGSNNHATKDCPHGILGSRTFKKHREESYSSTAGEGGGLTEFFGKMIGYIIAGVIVVAIVIWLAVNIVLPISLLNSALVLTVIAVVNKQHQKLFSILALVGASYMLLDIFSGWFSVVFVDNVVKNPNWISAFVYINSIAIGLSTWFLIQPIWTSAKLIETSNKKKSILLMGLSILLVAIAIVTIPILYNSIQNSFTQNTKSSNFENSIQNSNNQTTQQIRSNIAADTTINSTSVNSNNSSSIPFYMINIAAVKNEKGAIQMVQELKNQGYSSNYLWIPDYASLSGAKYYSIYIGPFSTQNECEIAIEEYRKNHPDAYGLLVSQERKRVEIRGIGKVIIKQN